MPFSKHALRILENRKDNEEQVFREDGSAFCYLDCYSMGNTESLFKNGGDTLRYGVLPTTEEYRLANDKDRFMIVLSFLVLTLGGELQSCSHPAGSSSPGQTSQVLPRVIATNSLAFHLQSLSRSTSEEERRVIESALELMQRYQVRSDTPLRSVWHDTNANEWILHFENRDPGGTFTIFLGDKDADWCDMQHTMIKSRRVRFPRESGKRNNQ